MISHASYIKKLCIDVNVCFKPLWQIGNYIKVKIGCAKGFKLIKILVTMCENRSCNEGWWDLCWISLDCFAVILKSLYSTTSRWNIDQYSSNRIRWINLVDFTVANCFISHLPINELNLTESTSYITSITLQILSYRVTSNVTNICLQRQDTM